MTVPHGGPIKTQLLATGHIWLMHIIAADDLRTLCYLL